VPESQGQNLALTVLYVPCLPDSGKPWLLEVPKPETYKGSPCFFIRNKRDYYVSIRYDRDDLICNDRYYHVFFWIRNDRNSQMLLAVRTEYGLVPGQWLQRDPEVGSIYAEVPH